MEEQKDAAKEAFDGTALAQFLFGPGRWQAGAVFLVLGVPGDDRDRVQRGMDPGDETQVPIGGVQSDDAQADLIEAHGPLKPRMSEGSIVDVGGGEQVEDEQPLAMTEQGMHAIAA